MIVLTVFKLGRPVGTEQLMGDLLRKRTPDYPFKIAQEWIFVAPFFFLSSINTKGKELTEKYRRAFLYAEPQRPCTSKWSGIQHQKLS